MFVIGFQLLKGSWKEIRGQESDAGSSYLEASAMPSHLLCYSGAVDRKVVDCPQPIEPQQWFDENLIEAHE